MNWFQDNSGLSFKSNNTSAFKIKVHSLAKENVEFTAEQLKSFSKISIDYLAAISGFQDRIAAKNKIDDSADFDVSDFQEVAPEYVYKYINEDSLKYYEKGDFQVGSTGYFQQMENEKARDELEGLTFISTRTNNRIINSAIELGFNHYIFCATNQEYDSFSEYHIQNFGSVLLKINAQPFFAEMAKNLGTSSYTIQNVKYANAKLLSTTLDLNINPDNFSNLSSRECLEYAKHLISLKTPSLFIKSGWFMPENELRVVFTMPHDVSQSDPKRFNNSELNRHIKVLKHSA